MKFVIVDRNERQWLESLEWKSGSPVPAKYNGFFVKRETLRKEFNGRELSRDEWVIQVDSLDELLKIRDIAPNNYISLGTLWDHPAIFV